MPPPPTSIRRTITGCGSRPPTARPLWNNVSATIGGRYQFASQLDEALLSPNTLLGNRYGADFTLSSPLTSLASGSLTLSIRTSPTRSRTPTIRAARTYASWRGCSCVPTRKRASPPTAIRSTRTPTFPLTAASAMVSAAGITTVDLQQNGLGNTTNVGGSAAFYGNRGEVRVAHNAGFQEVGWVGFNPAPLEQRSSVRVGTSLVFADGKFGIGAAGARQRLRDHLPAQLDRRQGDHGRHARGRARAQRLARAIRSSPTCRPTPARPFRSTSPIYRSATASARAPSRPTRPTRPATRSRWARRTPSRPTARC